MTCFPSTRLALAIAGCSLILSVVAIANGYPLVFPDTGVYLAQALELRGDSSRPPYYSLFLLPLHLGFSLWPAVFAQAAITAGVLYLTIRTVFGHIISPWYLLGITGLLAAFSSLPWHTGQLLPDVFTGVLILAVYVMAFGWSKLSRFGRVFIVLVLLAATAFHYSHLLLLAITGSSALLFAAWHRKSVRNVLMPAGLIVAAGLSAAVGFLVYSYAYTGKASLSPDSSKFMLARLIGDGTAVTYLQQVCPDAKFTLCVYLDEIKGDHNTFMWSPESPWSNVERELGFLGARDEAAAIVRGSVRAFPAEQARKSVTNFAMQLRKFGTGDTECPCIGDARVNQVIAKHFTREHDDFLASRQNQNALPINISRAVHTTSVLIAALGCAGFLLGIFSRQNASPALRSRLFALIAITVISVIANAAITGILSGPTDRYQSRVIWLIVLDFFLVTFPPASPRETTRP